MRFKEALHNLGLFEGKYVNDPDDKGGETYCGISRKNYPNWKGWRIIDDYKKIDDNIEPLLAGNKELNSMVSKFYKKEYWDKLHGDSLPFSIANELFEQSVNTGTPETGIKTLQKALNLLSRNGKLFKQLKVDGIIGNKTYSAINRVKTYRLLKVLNGLQFMHYFNLMENNSNMRKFVGWFDRT